MQKIADHPLLPESEIHELIRRYQSSKDQSAAERLIAHNERFIYTKAKYYYNMGICGDQEMSDLMQLGRMGMLRAMEDFNPDAGNKFITYAYNWVVMYISRYGKRAGQQIYMSDQAMVDRAAAGKAQARFIQRFHRTPTVEELASITELPIDKVSGLYVWVNSLDEEIKVGRQGHDDIGSTLGDLLPDPNANTSDDGDKAALLSQIMTKLNRLPYRDRQVIISTYGLYGGEPETLRQIAKRLNTSTEHVRKIKSSALVWLRELTIFDVQFDQLVSK